MFVIRHAKRDHLQKYLTENGIQSLMHYPIAPHKQDAYPDLIELQFPITEKIHNEVLSIPISSILLNTEIEMIITTLNKYK